MDDEEHYFNQPFRSASRQRAAGQSQPKGPGRARGFQRGRGGSTKGFTEKPRDTQRPNYRGSRNAERGSFGRQDRRDDNDDLLSFTSDRQEVMNRQGVGSNRGCRSKREYPMGIKPLEEMLNKPPDQVILELNNRNSGFDILVTKLTEDPMEMHGHKLIVLVSVLAHATGSRSNRESLHEMFNLVCQTNFLNMLLSFSMTMKRVMPDRSQEYFQHLLTFLESYANAMTNTAAEKLTNLLEGCVMALPLLVTSGHVSSELLPKYLDLQQMIETLLKAYRQERDTSPKKKWHGDTDDMEPPDDFHKLSVLPTAYDLGSLERPFLRRNIVEGKYRDAEHYLDVQFRLLREDFVRPLRNGINDFRFNNSASKNRDVRIYNGVQIISADIKQRQVIHYVHLNLPKKVSIENSKRLLYGNLLCFTNDNFKSLIFGSVFDRNKDDLKMGKLGVKFETDISDINLGSKFVMAESRAYFMSYKHVLKALQEFDDHLRQLPMQQYIVHVASTVDRPRYLWNDQTYDLRVLMDKHMMKKTEAVSQLFQYQIQTTEPKDDTNPNLRFIPARQEVRYWPLASEMDLDESQRIALCNALTCELAIIQGPPGTGKTHIGLKITQILLHNSQVWKSAEQPAPILVVCFTNHALDQFLEGMTSFTTSIVRIGSRTKSENIARFQINELVHSLKQRRLLPRYIHEMNFNLQREVDGLELEVKSWQKAVDECQSFRGIISCNILREEEGVMTNIYCRQLKGRTLVEWLLAGWESDKSMVAIQLTENAKTQRENPGILKRERAIIGQLGGTSNLQNEVAMEVDISTATGGNFVDNDDEIWEDAEELLQEEERDRRIYEDEDIDEAGMLTEALHMTKLTYELTDDMIVLKLHDAQEQLNIDENDAEAFFQIQILLDQKKALALGLTVKEISPKALQYENYPDVDIWKLPYPIRWQLYRLWTQRLVTKILHRLAGEEMNYRSKSKQLLEMRDQEYLHVMRQAAVVGMTTTGAAQYSNVMHDLSPKIVIIEEAAEILESHVVTAIGSNCQHLIMIGDHKQLQPSATVYELAKKYGLETSLFERMIKNGLKFNTLEYQHRMRPEISRLLVPNIYPELKDHASVSLYPHVRGVTKDVYFVSHQVHERQGFDDNSSHENQHEAYLIVALCRHLLLQGYSATEITILTPYSGQFFLIRKLAREYETCNGVRISVVDNFQGEENTIILLSLVRSNEEGVVGFLRTENRVCVALSRAKHGLYISGNMDQLCEHSELWRKIRSDLEVQGSYGKYLNLQCENHPDVRSPVITGDDILKRSPEGGCLRPCSFVLPVCRHPCPRTCHMTDTNHQMVRCPLPCPKVLCSRGHQCPRKCHEICLLCQVMVSKDLPCGHTHNIPCHVKRNLYKCLTIVQRVLPHCEHNIPMPCHADPARFQCPMPCDTRLDCGHKCRLMCHRLKDPDHNIYNCFEPCSKFNAGCTKAHLCQRRCYEPCGPCIMKVDKKAEPCGHNHKAVECRIMPNEIECKVKCKKVLQCNHQCGKLCCEPCGGCLVKVKKFVATCRHEVMVTCSKDPTNLDCQGKCPLRLPCGHMCKGKCQDPCTAQCTELVISANKCPRNHIIKLPCHLTIGLTGDDTWPYCQEPCQQALTCQHLCKGKCGDCRHGRLHIPCGEPCRRQLVCGHACKQPCSADCPPCQENCAWKCSHSRCRKKCGIPCVPCQEPCKWSCDHFKCNARCGEKCTRPPCKEPCSRFLKCNHPCVGFCGDPCPPLCRVCDKNELTEFVLMGNEDEEDARFVFLEDCKHCIEVDGLEGWLQTVNPEIGMKSCPKCSKPIYNNRRYQNFVLATYQNVLAVKSKYFTSKRKVTRKEIELQLKDVGSSTRFPREFAQISKILGIGPSNVALQRQKFLSDTELEVIAFQANVLRQASHLADKAHIYMTAKIQPKFMVGLGSLVSRVVQLQTLVSKQMTEEVTCELQRYELLPAYWQLRERAATYFHIKLKEIAGHLDNLFNSTSKFDAHVEARARVLLKESEAYVGGLGISDKERKDILRAMGLAQGHWYKCRNGHIYCITECGGAMQEAKCPECGAGIGGTNHALLQDNAVATEMDGSRHGAWSDAMNMGNFDLLNIV